MQKNSSHAASTAAGASMMLLQSTLHDLQVRSSVEEVLSDMLVDIELSAALHRDLETVSERHVLQRHLHDTKLALEERRAVEGQRHVQTSLLADALIEELWNLSRDLGEFNQMKERQQHLSVEHDETLAKLIQAEERIRLMEEAGVAAVVREEEEGDVAKSETVMKPVMEDPSSELSQETHDASSDKVEVPADNVAPTETTTTSIDAPAVPEEPVTMDPDESDAVVALIQEEPAPTLDTIDMTALTHIFGFLDALEILSAAQVNISMFSRVDALFGFSEGMEGPEEEQEAVISESAAAAKSQPTQTVTPSTAFSAGTETNPPAITQSTAGSSSAPAASTTAESPATGKASQRPNGGIFSLLQARGARAPRSKPTPTPSTTSQPLSAAMADSMASKLTDKELGAIISMKENLHKREKDVAQLTKEKEELEGRLDGTAALKEFLVNKVQEVETSLRKRQEDDSKLTQQIASDQEVIAFLDGRVQELERDIRTLTEERKSVVEELARVKAQNTKKITVLSDMLQFERERLTENEREWKATKKLLVKEIKSCRAQLLSLQAERDGFREQNEKLKRAIVSSSASNGSMRDYQ